MNIEIRKAELERILREEIQSGHFETVDELLTEALQALREKQSVRVPTQAHSNERAVTPSPLDESQVFVARAPREKKSLAQLFAESPFRGLDFQFERDSDTGRPAEL